MSKKSKKNIENMDGFFLNTTKRNAVTPKIFGFGPKKETTNDVKSTSTSSSEDSRRLSNANHSDPTVILSKTEDTEKPNSVKSDEPKNTTTTITAQKAPRQKTERKHTEGKVLRKHNVILNQGLAKLLRVIKIKTGQSKTEIIHDSISYFKEYTKNHPANEVSSLLSSQDFTDKKLVGVYISPSMLQEVQFLAADFDTYTYAVEQLAFELFSKTIKL